MPDVSHHIAVYVRQPEIAALIAIGEPQVIQPEQMQNSGLQVINRHWILADVKAEFIGRPIVYRA